MQSAITLTLARGLHGGRHLGRMSAVGAGATLAALGFAWVMSNLLPARQYHPYFLVAGGCIAVAALLCLSLSSHASGTGARARIILRREYGLYYLLTFLEGCRRQIFSIFASFALILVYHVPLRHMLLLQFINAILIRSRWRARPTYLLQHRAYRGVFGVCHYTNRGRAIHAVLDR
jgi:hypothetical protein